MQRKASKLLLLLVFILIVSVALSGCNTAKTGSSSAPSTAATPDNSTPKPEEKEVTLKFYFAGDKKSATDQVWSAISDYVKQKGLNVKFDINFIPFGDFKDKILVMSASGDTWDMNFDANWLAFHQMAAKGAYMSINDLLSKNAPNLFKTYQTNGVLKAATVNGQIVGLPWTMKQNGRPFAQWRSDVTQKANINPAKDSIQTIEDIDKLLHQIKQANPSAKITRSTPLVLFEEKNELIDIGFHDFVVDLNDPKLQVKPVEQTQAYRDAAKLAKKWYDDGILNKDAMVDKEDGGAQWSNGKLLFNISTHEWTNANPGPNPSFTEDHSLLYPDKKFPNNTALANVVAINKNSKNPDKVLQFLDLLETDHKLYDLVQYGIEGTTYKLDGKTANYPAGMEDSSSNYMNWGSQWALWKPQFMRPNSLYSDGFWVKEADFASQPLNINSPLDGLFIAEDAIKTEASNREQVKSEFGKPIEFGVVSVPDVDKAVDAYIEKQKAAGVDKLVAEAQKQIDQYLANSK